nr:MAG TPA: hypothetical protein [Caudoviricetes sp.]
MFARITFTKHLLTYLVHLLSTNVDNLIFNL